MDGPMLQELLSDRKQKLGLEDLEASFSVCQQDLKARGLQMTIVVSFSVVVISLFSPCISQRSHHLRGAQIQNFFLLLAQNSLFDKKISWAENHQVYQTLKLSLLVSLVWMNAKQRADASEDLGVVVEEAPEEPDETDDQEAEQRTLDPELFQTRESGESCYGPGCNISQPG